MPTIMNPLPRRIALTIIALVFTAVWAVAADPSGTWKFKAESAAGRSVESTLILKLENNQLTGSVDNLAGKADITNATFANDQVTFTVEREIGRRLRKQTFTVNYSGKLEGDTIKGTIQTTGRDKQPVTIGWEAKRAK